MGRRREQREEAVIQTGERSWVKAGNGHKSRDWTEEGPLSLVTPGMARVREKCVGEVCMKQGTAGCVLWGHAMCCISGSWVMTERRTHEESHGAWWNPAPTLGRRPFLRTAAAPSLLAASAYTHFPGSHGGGMPESRCWRHSGDT